MKRYLFILLFFLLLVCRTFNCCDDTKVKVEAYQHESKLCINNESSSFIWYFACDQDTAIVLDWAPNCHRGERIDGWQVNCIELNNITGYTEESDTILVYWWECENNEPGAVNVIEVPVWAQGEFR
ncbi:MAG: hypothetical protein K9M80_01910 [Candidatus Marinimicrobia bacterium]|nr:hypothetical protein [Candidatus Neomarinimicrobiota bacterium]